ncbi:MAG: hypothetical protein MI702_09485, partial [Chlorobiales bacterium]|nr:hypothetical protein [Chlorobiales bacterium]
MITVGCAALLIACAPQAQEATPSTPPSLTATGPETEPPTPEASETPAEKEPPAPTMDSGDCRQAGGKIQHFDLESQHLDQGLQFRVFTPPCYEEEGQRRYPVLYLIHGQTFNDDQWDRLGADETAAELIAAEEIAPFLIVMPFDISSTQPSLDPFDEAVVNELVPFIDAHFRTIAEREQRAVGGLSR